MIVIVIVGVIYTLAVTNLKAPKPEDIKPSLLRLKPYLLSFSRNHQSVRILCNQKCDTCTLYSAGKKIQEIESFFTSDVTFYRYDFFQGLLELQRESCFDFSVDANGVADQVVIIDSDNKVYDYTPYFQGTQEYDSVEAFVDAKERLIGAVE
jgi:hypothetical protein